MQHTIAAVYDRQSQAQQALDDLLASGFSRDEVHLSQTESSDQADQSGRSESRTEESTGGIRSFFAELFGTDSRADADLYSQAVEHGNYVLTVDVPDDDLVDRATDVLDRYDPVDIDEHASAWKTGAWAASDSMRQDEDTQQSSMQSAQLKQSAKTTQQTQATRAGQQSALSDNESRAIPVVEEQLNVGKRTVQRGGVRVFQRVIEKPVQENLELREERVTVDRRPVDQPASLTDADAFQETSFELRETAEVPVVEKIARVVEEVVVGKEVTQRNEQVKDTVRRTEVEVEQLDTQSNQIGATRQAGSLDPNAMDDDSYYRSHWSTNYAKSGGSYEDYEPAYRYGSTLSSNKRYTGQRWDDIESDVRSDWETRNPGSVWEKTKDAVRHGWEKMTGKSR
ncbi:hypothetical protein BH11PSE11_BH11PSE11_18580 [soil metagenome]